MTAHLATFSFRTQEMLFESASSHALRAPPTTEWPGEPSQKRNCNAVSLLGRLRSVLCADGAL
jgi:hypothetical protein